MSRHVFVAMRYTHARKLAAQGLDERAKSGFVAAFCGQDERLFPFFEHDR